MRTLGNEYGLPENVPSLFVARNTAKSGDLFERSPSHAAVVCCPSVSGSSVVSGRTSMHNSPHTGALTCIGSSVRFPAHLLLAGASQNKSSAGTLLHSGT